MTRRPLSERVYARLLRLFPDDFRRDFGPDMRDVFRDHLRQAHRGGWRAVIALWLRTIPDLVITGLHEREDHMLEAIVQDARYAARVLRKNPIFAIVAILVIALGTGAVSTIFSVANAIVLRPIPGVAKPSAVMSLRRARADGGNSRSASYPYYEYIATHSTTTRVAAWDMISLTVSAGGQGVVAHSNLVSSNYFDVVGLRPLLGRYFNADDGRVGSPSQTIVLGETFWQRAFNGDSAIVGRDVSVNGQYFTVIGIAPAKFSGLFPVVRTDAWVPMSAQPLVRRGGDLLHSAGSGWLDLFARLNPGVSPEMAAAELTALTKQYSSANETGPLDDMAAFSRVEVARATGLPMDATTPVIAFFTALLAISGLVLLIASVNVASMLLARSVARRREIAVRIALGAGRRRLIRQLLTESLLLFGIGGLLGTVSAFGATRLLTRIDLPIDVALAIDPTPDARVLAVTLAVALLTGLVFGLAPALQSTRADIASTLRGDVERGRSRSRLRSVLVGAQVAASLVLLTAGGLFVRALARGHHVDPGYDIGHVEIASLDVGIAGYDSTRATAFYRELRDRVANLPGVSAVAYSRMVPLSMNNMGYGITIEGSAQTQHEQFANANVVSEGYFDAIKLPIAAGRAIDAHDDASAPKVAVISQRFANKYWPNTSPLGHTFRLDSSTTVTVVGVVRDVKFSRLDEKLAPFMYLSFAQQSRMDANLLVRVEGDADALAKPIRDVVHTMDPNLPPPTMATLERASLVALLPQRFAAIVSASLGAAGLILAAIGLYGVLAFSTAQRTREMGIRMALGASAQTVVSLVVREGMRVVAVGIGIGLLLALIASRALAPFLFGVSPLDPVTYVVMTALLAVVAATACLIPARRAGAADPMAALRE